MNCPSCGFPLPDNVRFCGKCGQKIDLPSSTQNSNTQSQPRNPTPMPGNTPHGHMARFLSEEQEPAVVYKAHEKVSQILTRGEEILYIAVQKGITLSPDCSVLTNKRFIIYKPTLLGSANFNDFIWRDLKDVKLNEGMMFSSLVFHTTKGQVVTIGDLPKPQARKLYAYAQEMEEAVLEERRIREMEEKRAAAGGITIQGVASSMQPAAPSAPAQDDPLATLKKLKDLLDNGLITTQEYDAKKTEILSRM